jgi:RecJ-like exonuclease
MVSMSNPLTCQDCRGEGHIEVGDTSGEPTGFEDCETCDGSGIKPCIVCGVDAEAIEAESGEPVCRACEQATKEAA